jgi:citrate synthase
MVGRCAPCINVDSINVDRVYNPDVTQLVGAGEAARRLGIQRATLYAYVSRGLLGRRMAADGRTSLYAVDELDALAGRGRRTPPPPRPSIDVQIVTAVSTLDEDGVRYRGHDVGDLVATCSFEQVAELLWTGQLPAAPRWPAATSSDARLAGRVAGVTPRAALPGMAALATALGVRHPDDGALVAARRLLVLLPALFGGPAGTDGLAARVAACWSAGEPDDALVTAVDRTLVLLADHELATSTLAVRVAASAWTGPYPAFASGLAVIQGALHGGASPQVHELLVECAERGAASVVAERLAARQRLPGFGHRIYRGEDPRLRPLLDAVRSLPDPADRQIVVDDLLIEAGIRLTQRPNVDLGLGALSFVAGFPADAPLFAIARLAGFAAHYLEEREERPLRFRGMARHPEG